MYRFSGAVIFSFVLWMTTSLFADYKISNPDVTIIQSDEQSIIFDWQPQNFELSKIEIDNQEYVIPSFLLGSTPSDPGAAYIPWRVFTLGIPEGGKISIQILNKESGNYPSVNLAPIPMVYKDKSGVTNDVFRIDEQKYFVSENQPQSAFQLGEPSKFRDITIQDLIISPISYNATNRMLEFYSKIRVKVDYNQTIVPSKKFEGRGKLDKFYSQLILNFDQAQNWQTARKRSRLAKAAGLPTGTFYRIPVTEDGMYKIPASTLQSAGIQLSSLTMDNIQMFNNGGHVLNINVNAEQYNPEYTTEIPIFVKDQNGNGQFESSDYILFYGKGVNSWFFDATSRDFKFSQHNYATENYYLLTLNGVNGKRMAVEALSNQTGATDADYFYDRYHFEEDKYNLLASGPDWYGNRFFGLSDSYSKSFEIVTNNAASSEPVFKIQLKGGAGITYGDDLPYRYNFTILFNNNVLFNNISLSEENLRDYKLNLSDPSNNY